MVVGEHAVKAAQKAYRECEGDSTESHRAALSAALPFLPVQGAVKKLAWIRPPLSDTLSRCDTDFGTYRTWTHDEANGKWFWSVEGGWNETNGEAPNEEAAKAAAQSDFEARILSALEPSAARELALDSALRKMVALYESQYDADVPFKRPDWLVAALSSPDHADAGKVEGDGWMPGFDRLPTLQEAAFAAKVLNACNGYDLSVWTDDLWPCDDASEGLRAIIAHSVLPSAPSEGSDA